MVYLYKPLWHCTERNAATTHSRLAFSVSHTSTGIQITSTHALHHTVYCHYFCFWVSVIVFIGWKTWKKFMCKWTCTVQTCLFQGSAIFFLSQGVSIYLIRLCFKLIKGNFIFFWERLAHLLWSGIGAFKKNVKRDGFSLLQKELRWPLH